MDPINSIKQVYQFNLLLTFTLGKMQQTQQQSLSILCFISQTESHKPFLISNLRTNEYLTQGPQITCRVLSKSNIKQLWMFQKVKQNYVAIICFANGLALTRNVSGQQEHNFYCQKFKHKDNQMWQVQFVMHKLQQDNNIKQVSKTKSNTQKNQPANHLNKCKYFWVISKHNQQQCVFGTVNSPALRILKYDRTLFSSLWKIEQVNQNDRHFGFSQIRSSSNFLLQAPDISIKDEGPLILTRQHGRGTQKWIIQKLFQSYVIRNLCSGLVISISKQFPSTNLQQKLTSLATLQVQKPFKKITQQVFQNSKSQKWHLIKISQSQFYLQSVQHQDKFIGCFSTRQRDFVYLLDHQHFGLQMKNILWIVKGAMPEAITKQKYLDVNHAN